MKKNSSDRILMVLKMRGEATSYVIAKELAITKEGARKHLLNLSSENLVKATVKSEGVGRPSTYYSLTKKGLSRFPDTHAEVTVQLLRSVKKLLGDNALNLLISDRETAVYDRYEEEMEGSETLEEKLEILSKKRTEEGYMAEWKKEEDAWYLIENHCPICAAATACQGFCHSELNNFKRLIGLGYEMERVEYIIENGNRCVYKIEESK
ncbi:helix-turn-helix transcriptional regulator [Prolixibacter denitrificans]|uniref:Transcriptional regulator n=1 Tax=Prolixibacter denitrificans TaxID=1541063 RepID=A0A2P8CE86_9BACT|nr:metalloregulator ArsR/SmtB family transcription factor [Prolixibacter denitrificans]PSK83280.1 putative ArsR family transcriptional regulator [Prolixibacter denitrificans]GET21837.1 transcriptional regulator [Prolixibacter denitrificans]